MLRASDPVRRAEWVGPQFCFRPSVTTFARLLFSHSREADVESAGCKVSLSPQGTLEYMSASDSIYFDGHMTGTALCCIGAHSLV